MGLTSSKDTKEIQINADDVGVVRITEAAVDSIQNAVESKNKQANETSKTNNSVEKRENDAIVQKRLDELEKNIVNGFNKASKEVEEMFRNRYQTVPVCIDLQKLVNECYKNNEKHPLNCLDASNNYIKCVENERLSRFKMTS